MADKFTKEQLEEYKEAFAYFDRDKDGKLSHPEVAVVVRSLGKAPSEVMLKQILTEIGQPKIDFPTFLTIMMRKMDVPSTDEVIEALRVFDKDSVGSIPSSDLRHAMTYLGEKLSDREADDMLREADVDPDGNVRYENFVRKMMQWK
eukprot:TRINITY_DN311_c0_g1_i1.p1 TRINITY_DN311_c0_g1~~TRINITY_DN311_c0_g1_i1.p1  ORF type:complete len:147 (-),score=82.93 TRINITY_DN311_c0_g1_i1:188-628(-)